MISSYKKLKKQFEKDLKKLQENCKHQRLSEWMEIQWAPGHFSGNSCRVCNACNKRTHHKYIARICDKCQHVQHWQLITCMECKSEKGHMVEIYERYGKVIDTKKVKTNVS